MVCSDSRACKQVELSVLQIARFVLIIFFSACALQVFLNSGLVSSEVVMRKNLQRAIWLQATKESKYLSDAKKYYQKVRFQQNLRFSPHACSFLTRTFSLESGVIVTDCTHAALRPFMRHISERTRHNVCSTAPFRLPCSNARSRKLLHLAI